MAFDNLNLFGGSQSSDIASLDSVDNPLSLCPDSPNCIRITKRLNHSSDAVFSAAINTVKSMGANEIQVDNQQQKVDTVFKVFLFKDDMVIQIEAIKKELSYLYIRSASRVGESDLGINTRRVKRFLKNLKANLLKGHSVK